MINKVKGTYDILPNEIHKWHFLENKIREITKKYNYIEMRVPIMEYSELFFRKNEFSDMVQKETYNFKDKADRNITLRPEGTAGIIRSYIENKLYSFNELLKVYYVGQMFRYERPQKGRYRQFMQFGVEVIGNKNALLDADIIKFSSEFITSLGLKNVEIEINSLGDLKSREDYKQALINYLEPFKENLSNDSKARLKNNPLRILDSKDEEDIKIIKNAPNIIDYLSFDSKKYLSKIEEYLKIFKVNYKINNKLVRGLDYYSEIVFEVKANIKNFGAQNVLGGGGRYESLISELNGPKMGAIGFAFGMERLIIALESENLFEEFKNNLDAYVISFGEEEKKYAVGIFEHLRNSSLIVDTDFKGQNFKNQLKDAINKSAKFLIIIGKNELDSNTVTLKNTKSQQQFTLKKQDILKKIKEEMKVHYEDKL